MGRRRCCCGCWDRSDNFNRDDSDDPGDRWDERPGADWRIEGNQLVAGGSASVGKIIFRPNNGKVSFNLGVKLAAPVYQAFAESYWQEAGADIVAAEWMGLLTTRYESQRLLAFLVTAVDAPTGTTGFTASLQTCGGSGLASVDYESDRDDCEVVAAEVPEGSLGSDATLGVAVSIISGTGSAGQGLVATVYLQETVARKFGIIVNYVDDANYFLAEYTMSPIDTEPGRVELWRVAGGVKTSLGYSEQAPSEAEYLHVCFTPKEFFVTFTPYPVVASPPPINFWVTDPAYFPTGYKAGLYSDSTESVAFDDFIFSEHYWTNPECPDCACPCNDNVVPMNLMVTIVAESLPGTGEGAHPLVECLDMTEIPIAYHPPHLDEVFKWQGDSDEYDCPQCPWHCFSPFQLRVVLLCTDPFTLEIDGSIGPITCNYLNDTLTDPEGYCEPLWLEFTAEYVGCYMGETTTEKLRLTYVVEEF